MRTGSDRDDVGAFPLRQLQGEVADTARGTVDEHPGPLPQWHGTVLGLLERGRMVVAELDQELPCRKGRHRRSRGVLVVDARRLRRQVGGRRDDVLGVGVGAETGEAEEAEDLIADGESVGFRAERGDGPGDVGPGDRRQGRKQ